MGEVSCFIRLKCSLTALFLAACCVFWFCEDRNNPAYRSAQTITRAATIKANPVI